MPIIYNEFYLYFFSTMPIFFLDTSRCFIYIIFVFLFLTLHYYKYTITDVYPNIKNDREYQFVTDKSAKLLQGHYYRLYFRTSPAIDEQIIGHAWQLTWF